MDSWISCKQRGTWSHHQTKTWYENDVFLTNLEVSHRTWKGLHTCQIADLDHRSKAVTLELHSSLRNRLCKQAQKLSSGKRKAARRQDSFFETPLATLVAGSGIGNDRDRDERGILVHTEFHTISLR